MTTVEKLLLQIFERKSSIIEQVRQQTELYSHHLASKLLIDGITPPPWLWDADASSNLKELNKEEVISKLLHPHPHPQPQTSACCSFANYPLCSNLATTGDNEAFSEKNFMEDMAFSKGYHRDGLMVPGFSREDHAGCAIDIVPEPDASVTSPEDQTDERIVNNCNVEQSLSIIQRSRSRQKALELRNSAKSKAKSSRHENISNFLSNQIQFSLSSTNLVAQNDEVAKLAESDVGSQSGKNLDREANLTSKEKEMGLYSGRLTRSRSHSQGPVVDSLTLGCSSKECKDSASCHDVVAKLAESRVGSESGQNSDGQAGLLIKEKKMDLYSGRVTRSRSHSQGPVVRDSVTQGWLSKDCKDSASCHDVVVKLAEHVGSQSCKNIDGEADHLIKEKGKDLYSGRVTRSRSHSEGLVRDSLTLGCSSEDCKDSASCHDKVAKLAKSHVGSQSCMSLDREADLLSKAKEMVLYSARVNRSTSHSEGSLVRDSLILDGSSEASHVAEVVRERGSMAVSDSEHVVNSVNKLGMSNQPSAVCCQSCGNKKGSTADWINKDKETDTGRIIESKISVKCRTCACDSSRASVSFDHYQRLGAAVTDSGGSPDNVGGPLVVVSSFDVQSEDCEAQEPILEDCEDHRGRFRIPSLSSSQLNFVEDSHPEIPCNSGKAGSGIPTPSSRRASHLFSYLDELPGSVKPSVGSFHSVKMSQTHSNDQEKSGPRPLYNNENPCLEGTMSRSDCKQKSANVELHIVNRSSPLLKTHYMFGKLEIAGFSIPSNVKETIQLESLTVPTPSCSLKVAESLQPVFLENEEPNLQASASSSRKRRLANSAEKTSCPFPDPAMLLDKGVSGDVNLHSIGKPSTSKSACEQNSANVGLQIVNRSPSLSETHDMLGEHEIACFLIPSNAKERSQSECHIVSPTSGIDSVEPMQLSFIENEEHSLGVSVSSSQKRRITNSAEKMSCSMSDPAVCAEKGFCVDVIQLSVAKLSQDMSDVSDKVEEARCVSFESDAQKNPSTVADKFGCATVVSDYTVVRRYEDNAESKLNYEISEAHQEADVMASIMVDTSNMHIHPSKFQVEHGLESFPEQHKEEGNQGGEGVDNNQLMLNSPEWENLGPLLLQNSAKEPKVDSCGSVVGETQIKNSICVLEMIENFSAQESRQAGCSTVGYPPGENSSLERRCVHAGMESSWPQKKRRKIERLQTCISTAPPIPKARMSRSSLRSPARKNAENLEINGDAIMLDTSDVVKSTDVETFQIMGSNSTEGIESSFSSHKAEVTFCYKEKNVEQSFLNTEQLGAALVPSSTKEARTSQGSFIERMSTLHSSNNAEGARDGQCNHQEKNTNDLRTETLTLASTILDEMQSPKWEGDPLQPFVFSPSADDLNLIDVDQSMPVFEGFTVDAAADSGEVEFEANGINFDKIELPRNVIERASILAEICKSVSLNTPLSHFSSSFELQGTQHSCQSEDLYEHLNMQSTLPLSSDVEKQLQFGSVPANDCKNALGSMPYADFRGYSGVLYDWKFRNHYGSPVGKPWGEFSSDGRSSGKSSSSNPELVCFPIEEDPCGSDESKGADERENDEQEKNDPSSAVHCDKRQPLKDLTNLDLNPHIMVSSQEEMLRTDSVDFMSKKLSVSGTQDKVQLSMKNQYGDGSQTVEKDTSYIGSTDDRNSQTLSVGTNAIRKTNESISSISKLSVANKASLKSKDQKLSLKEPRRNNIVSNVNSFIPLVQQKKVSTVCTGKRDVKVKALEAAEAAKRLEEKRENERKMRKEALKVERAKLEERNLRNLELEKKRKEEERKKREVDNLAKKRLREEEAKKEKEKKRMKLETKHRRREQEEKMLAEKGGKEKLQSKEDQINSKKEFHNEYKNQLNMETGKRDDTALEKTETKWMPTDVAVNYEECDTLDQPCEAEKTQHMADRSPEKEDLIVQNSQEKSYEISPYQCSDDDEEEEDELPTRKYIPSWASKSSVSILLPLQQDMDPELIFPPESFCSIDQVLLPRKLHQKQMAS